jgi:cob(I)alamin adenosyltransferase
MSIATRTGDSGTTALMYNRRVPKCHPRVEACGTVDELNAALGMARALLGPGAAQELVAAVQRDLVGLMGELATASEDLHRYVADGFPRLAAEWTARLDAQVHQLEAAGMKFEGWVMPGETSAAAALDVARTVARRAERTVCALRAANEAINPEVLCYLNRLSDLLWLMARAVEQRSGQ